ncbi:hypothetical protein [Paraburkholderia mimosarum]|uniref:hypothetical protein n=1 Tax=Paraburkholderia mimosarum TaxID=312026 RepID=UPI0004049248|nr:hypothetical protein [Paraburkholderia mimosarum]
MTAIIRERIKGVLSAGGEKQPGQTRQALLAPSTIYLKSRNTGAVHGKGNPLL